MKKENRTLSADVYLPPPQGEESQTNENQIGRAKTKRKKQNASSRDNSDYSSRMSVEVNNLSGLMDFKVTPMYRR